jgi:phage head maturation protease
MIEHVKYDNLFRGVEAPVSLRADDEAPSGKVMAGHFAVFDEWTEINSWFEGRFMERLAPGAFAKSINDGLPNVRVQFDHGHDPHIGGAPLGHPEVVKEDKRGAWYEVPLFDTDYNRDRVVPLLEGRLMDGTVTGQSALGASFRFRVIRDEWNEEPGRSDLNPDGLPERTISEVRLFEFGPVVFGAYPSATSGMRCLTDHYLDLDRSRRSDAAPAGTSDRQPSAPPSGHPEASKTGRPSVAAARTTLLALKGKS